MDSSEDSAVAAAATSGTQPIELTASAVYPPPLQPLPPAGSSSLLDANHEGRVADASATPSVLTELFSDHKAARACQLLQELTTNEATTQVRVAFQAVEWAPNAFLLALTQWPTNAPRNKFYTLIYAGVECMTQREQLRGIPLSPGTSDLAGSLLVKAFADCRAPLVTAFATAFHVSTLYIQRHCTRLLDTQIKHVVTVVDTLNAHSLFPLDVVVEAAIAQNDLDAADAFVKQSVDSQRYYVQTLIDRRFHDKMIRKRMAKFRLDERTFPEFYERRMRASLRFLIYNQQYEDVLETVLHDQKLGSYACDFILSQRGDNDALAQLFVHRSGLANHYPLVNTTDLTMVAFPNKDELEPMASCLSITELAGEDCCVFVDTPEALDLCVAHLREAAVVGFDCEWKTTTQGGQKTEACAVMQLASATRAFVVDTIALKGQCMALSDVFLSDAVMKLGFDTKQDVSVVAKVLYPDGDSRNQELVKNLVDVQALAKRLRNLKRPRLEKKNSGEVEDGEIPEDGEVMDDTQESVSTAVEVVADGVKAEAASISAPDEGQAQPAALSKKELKKLKKKNKRAKAGNGDDENDNGSNLSLAAVAETYLGKPLDKRSRMSDWERRPLTKAQLTYAALDALVLVAILDKMKQQFAGDVFDQALAQILRARSNSQKKQVDSDSKL